MPSHPIQNITSSIFQLLSIGEEDNPLLEQVTTAALLAFTAYSAWKLLKRIKQPQPSSFAPRISSEVLSNIADFIGHGLNIMGLAVDSATLS